MIISTLNKRILTSCAKKDKIIAPNKCSQITERERWTEMGAFDKLVDILDSMTDEQLRAFLNDPRVVSILQSEEEPQSVPPKEF